MKLKVLLILMLAAVTFTSYAQDGGIRGKVVSRNGRVALSNVQVKIESLGLTAMTDKDGNFIFENLPAGSYTVLFSTPDFEDLNLMVRVGNEHVQDLKSVIIVPSGQSAVLTTPFSPNSTATPRRRTRRRCLRRSLRRRTSSTTSHRTVSARCVSTSAATIRSTRTST